MRKRRIGSNNLLARHKFITALIIGLLILLGIYISVAVYFKGRVMGNTRFRDVDISLCTAGEVDEKLNGILQDYVLNIELRDGASEYVRSYEAGMEFVLDDYGEKLIDGQNIFAWPVHLFKETVIEDEFDVSYDEKLLEEKLESMECLDENNAVKPEDAYVADYQSGQGFQIIPEVMGTLIDKNIFRNIVKEALSGMQISVNADEKGCYINPEKYAADSDIVSKAEYLNKFTNTNITYHFGEEDIVINGDTVFGWMKIKKNGKVELDESKIKEFVNGMGTRYDTIFRSRKFMTSYGQEVTLDDGDYGWWMNRDAEVKEIIKLVKKGEVTEREPVYYQKAAQYGSKDYGNTYVEINLTAQHLFLYKKGKLVLESEFVSGKNTKDRRTPTGVYGITYKERDATLVGADYETPVSYWMPFNGSVGLHDATWRNKFGASLYKYGGSHGCINLPFKIAAKIYDKIDKGTAVICYELPGTESTTIVTQSDEEIALFVTDAIDRIGKVNKERKLILEKFLPRIRECYAGLSGNQKKYVTNLDKLEAAEKAFKKLK